MVFAQSDVGVSDNNWLDQFRIPVGDWFTQTVDWVDGELGWLLGAIKWPFQFLFDLLMNDNPNRDSIMSISWVWLVLGFFVLGSVLRNTKIGFMSAAMVGVCGILGQGYWFHTSKTFGMIFVSVFLCTLFGLPLGVLCGRSDAVWNLTRPVLDAMQVVHSFVWMLPFIAFWGIGEVAGTMVTMLFALPPMVRLTNLGIRQVPDDVVEASRSYGANEFRVLTDVQLPLARPAIMTGLNQTLLLAISMLGIVALMGADGLGKLIFRAINNLDLALAASAGLGFFLVAVVLDRISQPEGDDGLGLFARIGQAWSFRADPEGILEARGINAPSAADKADAEPAERPVPVETTERIGLLAIIAGSALALVSTVLPWVNDAGIVSAWGTRDHENLLGQTMNGLEGAGGSFFGIMLILFASVAILAAVRPLVTIPNAVSNLLNKGQGVLLAVVAACLVLMFILNLAGSTFDTIESIAMIAFAAVAVLIAMDTFVRGAPRLGVDGALIASLGALAMPLGMLWVRPPVAVQESSLGFGVYLALLGTVVAVGGGLMAMRDAPYTSRRPLPTHVSIPAAAGAVFAGLVVLGGASAAWMVDEREGFRNREFFGGLSADGPRLGQITLYLALAGVLVALVATGVLGIRERRHWQSGTLTAGLGLATVAIPLAWTLSMSRSGDTDYFADKNALTGAGVLLALAGGAVLFAIGRSVIKEFRRRKIYAAAAGAISVPGDADGDPDADLALTGEFEASRS